jgi:hypothetical protein
MAGEALRSVFADFGFNIDASALEALNDKVDSAASDAGALAEAVREASVIVDDAYAREAKAAEESAAKTAAASKTMVGAAQQMASQRWGVKVDTAEIEAGSKRVDEAFKAMRLAAETALGQRLFDRVSKLSPAFAGLAQRLNVGAGEMAAFGRIAVGATLGVVAAIGGGTVAALAFARAFEADAAALRDASDAARVTTTQYQALGLAGARAGVSASVTTGALNTLAAGLRAIESRSGGPTGALWRLGVRARDTAGRVRDTQDVMEDLADRFERVQNPIHRARLAQQLFGAEGRRMLDVLRGGSVALRAARQDLADLGGGMLPEATEASRRFGLAQNRMGIALNSLRSVLAVAVLPILTTFVNGLANVGGWVSRMVRGSNLLQVALGALGVAAAAAALMIIAAWAPIVAPFLAVGLAVGALLLIVDDLVTAFQGGESEAAKLVDTLFGVGTAAQAIEDYKAAWEAVVSTVERAIAAIARLTGLEPSVAQGTLRAPTFGTPARAPARPRAAAPAATAPVATRTAGAAPGLTAPVTTTAPVARTVSTTVHDRRTTANTFQITGVTDPQAVAQRVSQILDERRARERDAAHPQDVED